MPSLYEQILSLCQDRGIRPGRLCDELGLSRGLMSDLKMGRKKSLNAETAQKIAAYLGISIEQLLGYAQPAENHIGAKDILEDVDIAFYGEFKELNDEDKEAVRDMVRIMRERRTGKPRD